MVKSSGFYSGKKNSQRGGGYSTKFGCVNYRGGRGHTGSRSERRRDEIDSNKLINDEAASEVCQRDCWCAHP